MKGATRLLLAILVMLSTRASGDPVLPLENADTGVVLDINPGPDNPRNSEGDFITLKDGRILFVYTRFTGESGDDNGKADLTARYSSDDGHTWTDEDRIVVANEGLENVMSVSLLRLDDDTIGLFYLRKNSWSDCRPYVRTSKDEGETWGEPSLCVDRMGYYVLNNDRVVKLRDGRLVMPLAAHAYDGERFKGRGQALCYLSDDLGATWQPSAGTLEAPADSRSGLQEPGVIELSDGRLMMLCRTDQGCQMRSWSSDRGVTWSPVEETDLLSPVSPASFERIPESDRILLVWNDHAAIPEELKGKRTPLSVAVSEIGRAHV